MVEIYVMLVIHGRRSFEKVPEILQKEVGNELELRGFGVDGKSHKKD